MISDVSASNFLMIQRHKQTFYGSSTALLHYDWTWERKTCTHLHIWAERTFERKNNAEMKEKHICRQRTAGQTDRVYNQRLATYLKKLDNFTHQSWRLEGFSRVWRRSISTPLPPKRRWKARDTVLHPCQGQREMMTLSYGNLSYASLAGQTL